MCFFKKKKNVKNSVLENKEMISRNSADLELLSSKLSDKFMGISQTILDLSEQVKYFNPTSDESVKDLDNKIHHKIDDLKIDVVKSLKKDEIRVEDTVSQLKDLITERTLEEKRFKRK